MVDFLHTLVLLGSIQGIVIGGLLFFSEKRLLCNRLLAGIIALLALPGFHLYFHYKQIYELNGLSLFIHDIVPMVVVMPLGPLVYFYVQSLTTPRFVFDKKLSLHFLPSIIDFLPKIYGLAFYMLTWLGYDMGDRLEYAMLDNWYNKYADIPRWLSISIYLWFAFRYLQAKKRENAIALKKVMPWLNTFVVLLFSFQVIWLLYLVPYVIPVFSERLLALVDWFPLYIPMMVLVYWLGIQGYLTSLKLNVPKKKEDVDWLDAGWQRLSMAMEQDRLYLDAALNLDKMAGHVGLSTRQISEILNQHKALNFNTFINHYRVEEFKSRLIGDGVSKFTMAGLAQECGFSSAATFQRIFKQFTGMAPSVFLKMVSQDSINVEKKA